jgi:hypothetical protein
MPLIPSGPAVALLAALAAVADRDSHLEDASGPPTRRTVLECVSLARTVCEPAGAAAD